jgi:hypothetical protein
MTKYCLINQPAGIGDILYCQAIAWVYVARGYKVIWPIIDAYQEHTAYFSSPHIEYVPISSSFIGKDIYLSDTCELIITPSFVYIPLKHSAANKNSSIHPLMLAKYGLCGLLPLSSAWLVFLQINRNIKAEEAAFSQIVGDIFTNYAFLNNTIGSPDGNMQELEHVTQSAYIHHGLKLVRNDFSHGINLFNYMQIISKATEIHTANTSLCYLIEYMCHNSLIANPSQLRFMYTRDLEIGREHV